MFNMISISVQVLTSQGVIRSTQLFCDDKNLFCHNTYSSWTRFSRKLYSDWFGTCWWLLRMGQYLYNINAHFWCLHSRYYHASHQLEGLQNLVKVHEYRSRFLARKRFSQLNDRTQTVFWAGHCQDSPEVSHCERTSKWKDNPALD